MIIGKGGFGQFKFDAGGVDMTFGQLVRNKCGEGIIHQLQCGDVDGYPAPKNTSLVEPIDQLQCHWKDFFTQGHYQLLAFGNRDEFVGCN